MAELARMIGRTLMLLDDDVVAVVVTVVVSSFDVVWLQ